MQSNKQSKFLSKIADPPPSPPPPFAPTSIAVRSAAVNNFPGQSQQLKPPPGFLQPPTAQNSNFFRRVSENRAAAQSETIRSSQPVPPPVTGQISVVTRSVWSHNLDFEFRLIRSVIDEFSFVSMDTEFPGIVFRNEIRSQNPNENYNMLKQNVDNLKLIQVGLTLADKDGNLPDLGTKMRFIWEFNFKDFDVARDKHSAKSIELLRQQGVDFDKNLVYGVDAFKFSELMMASGLVCNHLVSWVTFHGAYDFGLLIKVLTGSLLPDKLSDFLILLKSIFGPRVYDVKHLARFVNGLYGGLDRVAKSLELERCVGKSHQAGSDSLLTWDAFQKIKKLCKDGTDKYAGVLYGLEVF